MKTLKQKTLSLALFGLLAANSSYSLISQGSIMANSQIEGQTSLASTNEQSSISKVKALQADKKAQIKKVVDKKGEPLYYTIELKDVSSEDYKYFTSSDRVSEGFVPQSTDEGGIASDNRILLRYYPETVKRKIKLKIKGKEKETEVALNRSLKITAGGLFEKDSASYSYKTTEGQEVADCNDCGLLPQIAIDDLSQLTEKLEESLANDQKTLEEEKEVKAARLCQDKKHKKAHGDAQLKCLIANIQEKREGIELSEKEMDASKDALAAILTKEFEDDVDSDRFEELYSGNLKFRSFAEKVRKEVVAKEQAVLKIERQTEDTEKQVSSLEEELSKLNRMKDQLASDYNKFETYRARAKSEVSAMEMRCNGGFGGLDTPDYIGGGKVYGVNISLSNGIETFQRDMNPMMNTSMMNPSLEQTTRNLCLQQVEGRRSFYNWELNNFMVNRIQRLQSSLSNRVNGLDTKVIFPVTYKKEKDFNGGLNLEQYKYYENSIESMKRQLQELSERNQGLESELRRAPVTGGLISTPGILPANNNGLATTSGISSNIINPAMNNNQPNYLGNSTIGQPNNLMIPGNNSSQIGLMNRGIVGPTGVGPTTGLPYNGANTLPGQQQFRVGR